MPPPQNIGRYHLNPQSAGPSPPQTVNDMGRLSNTPPSNISPTNYHANPKQLREQRRPLYVPAALRPNDRFARPTNIPSRPRPLDTPPGSNESSFDGGKTGSSAAFEFLCSSYGQNDDAASMLHVSRTASETMSMEDLGEVTGPPTTAHWKPDESAAMCFICEQTFTWYFRRHHCRSCGNVVCGNDLVHSVPLDQNARLHPDGQQSKACGRCFDYWKHMKRQLQHSRASSISESTTSSQGTAMPIPNQRSIDENLICARSLARSEGGMVWSTF